MYAPAAFGWSFVPQVQGNSARSGSGHPANGWIVRRSRCNCRGNGVLHVVNCCNLDPVKGRGTRPNGKTSYKQEVLIKTGNPSAGQHSEVGR